MDCDNLQYLGWFNHQESTNRAFKRGVEHCSFGSTDHTAQMAQGALGIGPSLNASTLDCRTSASRCLLLLAAVASSSNHGSQLGSRMGDPQY